MTKRRDLTAELTKARQQLQKAQLRVAALEAQVTAVQIPAVNTPRSYQIFDNMLEGCQLIDFDWRYRYLNDKAVRHALRSRDELLGSTMMEQYPAIEQSPMFAVLQRCMQERTAENIESEFSYPDGTIAWFELRVQPVPEGIFVFSLDITERKRTEAAEREQAEWMRMALAASHLGKWQHDIATGVIRFDERARLQYGFACETVTIDRVLNQLHPEDVSRLGEELAFAMNPANDGRFATEYRVVHPDGSVHWLAVQAQVYFAGEGQARYPARGFGTCQEITVRKAAEDALKRYTLRLEILRGIDIGIINAHSIPEIMATSLKQIRAFFGCQQAGAFLFDFSTDEVLLFAGDAHSPSAIKQGVRYPLTPGFLEEFGAMQVTVIDDLLSLPASNPSYQHVKQEGMRSSLRALLMLQERPLGVLVLNADTPNYFTAEQQAIAAEIANQLAIAIRQQQLADDLAHHVQTLEEMRQFLQTTLDAFPANTTVLDPNGTIITVNLLWKHFADENNAQSTTHYLGANYLTICNKVVGPMSEEAAAAAAGIQAVIAGRRDDFYQEYSCNSPTQERWFMLRVTPFVEPTPRRVVVAHIDITERKAAEKAEHEQRLLAEALRDSLVVLTASVDVETVMQQILAHSATVIPSEAGTIILFEGNQGRVAYLRGHSAEAEAFFKANPIAFDAGVYAGVYGSSTYYLVADTKLAPDWRSFPVTGWVRSSIGVQIVVRGEPIGLLIMDSATPNRFQQKDVENLQSFARYAALALENAHHVTHLEQRVRARTVELRSTKERVEAILNNSADGILLIHLDLSIQQTNPSFNRLFGCETDEYLDKLLVDLIQPEDFAAVIQLIQAVAMEQPRQRVEVRAKRKDGTLFDVELSIGLIKGDGLVCTIRDITERKVRDRQLRYHASLQENVSDAVIVMDMDSRIQSWNQAAARLYGWTAAETVGKWIVDIVYSELTADERERVIAQVRTQRWWQGELTQRHKNGQFLHILSSASLVYDESGTPFGFVIVNHDITERKQQEELLQRSEKQLQESQKMLQLVLDTIPVRVFWKDRDSIILGCNRLFAQDAGFDNTNHLIGKGHGDLTVVAIEAEQHQADDVAIMTTGIPKLEYEETLTLANREMLRIQTSKLPLRNAEGDIVGLLGAYADITVRKKAEEALQNSAAEIFDLYNNAPCGYHSIDKNGVIIEINDTELRWLGYDRAEVINKIEFIDILTPESLVVFQQNFPLFKARGWVNDLQFEVVRKDGSIIHVLLNGLAVYDKDGQYLKSRTSVFDITELKQAEQALVESEARYRLLAENVLDVIAKMNLAGIRTFITPSCYALFGYTPDELIGKPNAEIVHPDDLPFLQTSVMEALNTGKSAFVTTIRTRHKAGHYVWIEASNNIVYDPATGKPVEMIGVIRDISERKRTEAILMARMEEEREFQGYLKALHEITIELTQIDDLDAFYQSTVELGLMRLNFDRLGLFLYDEEAGTALGTYGTDAQGKLVNKQHICFTPNPNGIMQRSFTRSERFCFDENIALYENQQLIGVGWNAAAVLWNGTQRMGWLVIDNLLSQKPASKPQLDTLGLYALTVGTLLAQKQVQLALRESETRYRLVAENISDVVVRTNAAAECLYVSPSSRIILGYEPTEFVGQSVITFVHPEDLPAIEQALLGTRPQNRSDASVIVRFRHKQGHYLWLEIMIQTVHAEKNGEIEGFVGSARDISDRKDAEAALKESEAQYRRLIENMRGGLAVYDVNDRVTYVNDRACEMLGFPRSEIMGTRPYDHVDDSNAQKIKTQLGKRRLQEVSPYELLIRRKDGSPSHLLISGSSLFDKDGVYNGSLIVTTDITVQKQAEETLRQALVKEKELGELKSRFISMASHEFRTPLATIFMLAETLSAYRHRLSEAQIEQRLNRIKEQVDHLKDIMEDVLLLAQMQARRAQFNPIKLDLDALCRTILDEFQSRVDIKHQLEYRRSEANYIVKLDPKLMRQIISNLVSNAIKYSPANKPIQVTLEFVEDVCVLQVQDEGIGIPATDLQHLFEPFHRAANVGAISGTGLGLVITKEAVELHGGTITCESQLERGTTFTIRIPIFSQEEMAEDNNSSD